MSEQEISNLINKPIYSEVKPLSGEARSVLKYYEELIATPHVVNIGPTTRLPPRYHGDEAPGALREYSVEYPQSLNEAYAIVCKQHDDALMQVVEGHKEASTDYQFAPGSLAFQVDGPAFPDQFLDYVADIDPLVLAQFLRARIFEVENNIAGYDLNGRLWPHGTTNETWNQTIETVRQITGKKVAVLASTDAKFEAILLSELGIKGSKLPSEEKIRITTGFDAFLGPEELIEHYQKYDGRDSDYVFFGRTSQPTSWLINPNLFSVEEPFLADPELRRYVRSYAITHNFDNPEHSLFDPRVITDTKAALCMIGAAHLVTKPEDIYSQEFLEFLAKRNFYMDGIYFPETITDKKKKKLGRKLDKAFFNAPRNTIFTPQLINYLESNGIDSNIFIGENKTFRAKPLKRHYGAYGHIKGALLKGSNKMLVFNLMKEIEIRGQYVLQPELQNLQVIDQSTGNEYLTIDRVFFVRNAYGNLQRMEGIRAFMPKDSPEGQKNNVHDGRFTLDAPIV